ncbi:MAG: hypothetical protein HOH43_05570 [Candidatus Latescibacteria bacterium]|nr:hypothetical protein [Candidatus Latescibacterota bacterium]
MSVSDRLGRALPETFQDVGLTNTLAFKAYRPQPFSGDVALFLSREITAGYSNNPEADWSGVGQGDVSVNLIEDDGITGHQAGEGMFVEPFVGELARKLEACLADKRESSARSAGIDVADTAAGGAC